MQLRPLLFAFVLASCLLPPTSSYTPTGVAAASTRAPAEVEVLVGVQPQRTFAQRGVIRISGPAATSAIIAEAKEAGAANGCDAVVLTMTSDVTTGACIVYTATK